MMDKFSIILYSFIFCGAENVDKILNFLFLIVSIFSWQAVLLSIPYMDFYTVILDSLAAFLCLFVFVPTGILLTSSFVGICLDVEFLSLLYSTIESYLILLRVY